ncbi:MAG TPA: tail fiber protein [Actinomycetota bacterium]|jgi:microcystin-dependent protein
MADPFLGEVRLMSFDFAPKGWALCNGQFLPVNQNQALFALLGTTYGGDGRTLFALPDLRGRVPIHTSGGFPRGSKGGEEAHTLSQNELPAHNHTFSASSTNADAPDPTMLAKTNNAYGPALNFTTLSPASVSKTGSGSHQNMQPYSVISFCIALQGIFPSPN